MDEEQRLDGTGFLTVHKGFKIVRDKSFGTFSVVRVGKGRVPDSLTGSFQTRKMLVDLIDRLDVKDS